MVGKDNSFYWQSNKGYPPSHPYTLPYFPSGSQYRVKAGCFFLYQMSLQQKCIPYISISPYLKHKPKVLNDHSTRIVLFATVGISRDEIQHVEIIHHFKLPVL